MKGFQNVLRGLILAGSIAGFLGGWGVFAHSGKPAPTVQPPQVQLAPDGSSSQPFTRHRRGSDSLQPFGSQPSFGGSSGFTPRLRTGGS